MAIVVLRAQTLTASGTMHGETYWTLVRNFAPTDDFPALSGETHGAASVTGLGSIAWESYATTTLVGFQCTVVGPNGTSDVDTGGDSYTAPGPFGDPVNRSKTADGTWSISADCELCEEWAEDVIPSGTGSDATGFNPDPPHTRYRRIFWRTKSGGTWSGACALGGASASYSYTFGSATEIGWPDCLTQSAYADATSQCDTNAGPTQTTTASQDGTYRTATLTTSASASGAHGNASAAGTTCDAVASVVNGGPYHSESSMTAAVPAEWSIDAQLRAMEASYPESLVLRLEAQGTTVDTSPATGSYSHSDTMRYEVCQAYTYDTTDSDGIASTFGPLGLSVKESSAADRQEPTTDLRILLHARQMSGITVSQPASTNLPSGSDSALGGSPWGVTRSWSAVGAGWVGLMGWRYLAVPVTTASGTGSQAATVRIGSKTWTQDYTGAGLTTPALSGSATWTIDLCSPDGGGPTDETDTTWPYNDDWDVAGGDEDDYYRTGEGSLTGVHRAASLTVEVGASASLTLGTLALTRTDTNDATVTVLGPHRAWVNERPDRVVSEADTTTEYFVRQTFANATEGRLLALEWTDTLWKRTTGGASGVVTHTVTGYPMTYITDRISAAALVRGWTCTTDAPAVSGSGVAVWYNREREVYDLLGGGYWFEPYSITYPTGRWRSGIDYTAAAKVSGSITNYGLKWQGRYYRLTQLPGDIGDVDGHLSADTDGPTPLKASKILRCQGEGMSLDTSGVAHSGDTLTLTQSGASQGTGTTDAYGYAQTGNDYGFGNGATAVLSIGTRTGSYTPRARKRFHFRAMPVDSVSVKSIDTSPTGRTVVAYEVGSGIRLAFMLDSAGLAWDERDIGLTGTEPAIRYIDCDGMLLLCLLYLTGGALNMVTTDDEGRTLSVPSTVWASGATHPALDVYPTGWALVAARVGSTIEVKHVDRAGTVLRGPTVAVASGVDDDGIGVTFDRSAQRWYVVYTASGVLKTTYSDDTETWV